MIRRPRHAEIHLPPLSDEAAYFLVAALEAAVREISRAHGDAIADFQGRVFPDAPPPPDAVVVVDNDVDEGDDVDF